MTENRDDLKRLFLYMALSTIFIVVLMILGLKAHFIHNQNQQHHSYYERSQLKQDAQSLMFQTDKLMKANKVHKNEHARFASTPKELFDKEYIKTMPTLTFLKDSRYQFNQKNGHIVVNDVPSNLCLEVDRLSARLDLSNAFCFAQFGNPKPTTLLFFN